MWARASSYCPENPDLPRTHICLVVRARDDLGVEGQFLCDPGFGGGGPATPLPLLAGDEFETPQGETYRLVEGSPEQWEDTWILEVQGGRRSP